MKIFTIIFALVASLFLQTGSLPNKDLSVAFEKNNAAAVVALSEQKLLLGIEGDETVYSKSQAQLVIQRFFDKNQKGKFTYSFEGDSSKETTFTVGEYVVDSRKFRVTMQYRKIGNTYKIESLSIE